ncbi:MAG: hypothetical protein A2Y75_05545 [Candidatus Solincola sediminis]|uniref:Uncharacterized protein n=1 Tax=Candidatus Solincola sediminis TaxID=1797199 RepID=A0A1F2WFM7_9ACTN|nr:MAG: hypothetical protein A2Y75_05545 [Candidatus Solincola sediminis]
MKKTVIVLIVVLLLAAGFLEWGVDRRSAQVNEEGGGEFNNAARVLDFLGGVRQYLAYSFFIKADRLSHEYSVSVNNPELVPYFFLITMLDPQYVRAYYVVSGMVFDLGYEQEAIDYVKDGLQANPESSDLYYSLGMMYFQQGRYEEALEAFNEAAAREPGDVSIMNIDQALAACYRALGRSGEAAQSIVAAGIAYNLLKLEPYADSDTVRGFVNSVNIYWSLAHGDSIADDGLEKVDSSNH